MVVEIWSNSKYNLKYQNKEVRMAWIRGMGGW